MPPKAPSLKFKPKFVLREQQQQQQQQSGDSHAATMLSSSLSSYSSTCMDELSLVQLERMRRQQQGTPSPTSNSLASNTRDTPAAHAREAASSNTAGSTTTHTASPSGSGRTHSHSLTRRGEGPRTMLRQASSSSSPLLLSRLGVEEQRNTSFMNDMLYPSTALPLAKDSINTILVSPVKSGWDSHGCDPRVTSISHVYRPIPLDDTLTAHMRQRAQAERTGADTCEANLLSTSAAAPEADSQNVKGSSDAKDGGGAIGEDGDSNSNEHNSQQISLDDDKGTAFLREYDRETREMYAANMRFYRDIVAPARSGVSDVTDQGNQRRNHNSDHATTRGDAHTSGSHETGASSMHRGHCLDPAEAGAPLVWMQIPRFHDNAPYNLDTLPPGRVGELTILRSGRMIMTIAGVRHEVAVEGGGAAAKEREPYGMQAEYDGSSAVAAAVLPGGRGDEGGVVGSCIELGALVRKLVCTPVLDEELY